MDIYRYTEYRKFLKEWVENQGARGKSRELALQLGVHTSLISQVLNEKRHLSLENVCELSEFLRLSSEETEFLFVIYHSSRAGSERLKQYYDHKIQTLLKNRAEVRARLSKDAEPIETVHSEFYSSWLYSAIRNLSAINSYKTTNDIAKGLGLPRTIVKEVCDFLVLNGLCEIKEGELTCGPPMTHISRHSPVVKSHHSNWRIKAIERVVLQNEKDLFFTMPMSLSEKDAEKFREALLKVISTIHKDVRNSKSETVRTLNIDFFSFIE